MIGCEKANFCLLHADSLLEWSWLGLRVRVPIAERPHM